MTLLGITSTKKGLCTFSTILSPLVPPGRPIALEIGIKKRAADVEMGMLHDLGSADEDGGERLLSPVLLVLQHPGLPVEQEEQGVDAVVGGGRGEQLHPPHVEDHLQGLADLPRRLPQALRGKYFCMRNHNFFSIFTR